MAIFELKKECWYQGMWKVNFSAGDFLAMMWRENGEWIFKYRFRYYTDDKVWESDDPRSIYQLKLPDEPGAKEKMFQAIQQMLATSCERGFCNAVEYYPCGGDGDAMGRLMASGINGLHAKRMTKDEYEEYVRTNRLPDQKG